MYTIHSSTMYLVLPVARFKGLNMVRLDIRSGIRGYGNVVDRLHHHVLGKSQISSHWVTCQCLLLNIAMVVTVREYLACRC